MPVPGRRGSAKVLVAGHGGVNFAEQCHLGVTFDEQGST